MFHAPMRRFQLELIYYLSIFPPSSHPTVVCFFSVGLTSLIHFQSFFWVLEVTSVSWLGQLTEFKSLIIVIVCFHNFVCCLVWATDLGVQITDEGRSFYVGSFCPAMTLLSRYLEVVAFSISISSSVFIFL